MTESFSIDDLRNLLNHWWGGSASPVESAPNASDSKASVTGEAANRSLQQAEVMMGSLPADQVAECVLSLLQDKARSTNESETPIPVEQKCLGLVTAWSRAEKQHWTARRQAWDDALDQLPASGNLESALSSPSSESADEDDSPQDWLNLFGQLYRKQDKTSLLACSLLGVLAWQDANGLKLLAQLLAEDPPTHPDGISRVFSPLVFRDDLKADALFPKLLEAMGQLPLATAVLDLGNYLYRERQVRPHVAWPRKNELAGLLANVTQRLLKIEESPAEAVEDASQLSQIVNDSVGLISALCDALALIGDPELIGKIYPCLEVKHRRVQLEAANALAVLGDKDAKDKLIEMASEPVVRRRVLAYCEQLGCLEKVDSQFKTASAEAEAELALWLSHPSNMGLAPFEVSVIDQCQQYWPGYDQPVDCFLLRYTYPFDQQQYQNVGLVGPITHSFSTSLNELPAADVYAVFAGWHVEHPEIYTVSMSEAGPLQKGTIARLERRLHDEGFELSEAQLLGHCLGIWSLIGRASRDEREGWVAADQDSCVWLPDDAGFADFDAGVAWYLHLGRKLLQQFNSTDSEPN